MTRSPTPDTRVRSQHEHPVDGQRRTPGRQRTVNASPRRPVEDDFDELRKLAEHATRRRPGFADAVEDAQLRNSVLAQVIALRKSLGLSRRVVAERMQTTRSAVVDLENGAIDPHLSTVQRYARAVGARLLIEVTR